MPKIKEFDIVKYVGEETHKLSPKKGDIGIVRNISSNKLEIAWKGGSKGRKLAWFEPEEFELVKAFKWPNTFFFKY